MAKKNPTVNSNSADETQQVATEAPGAEQADAVDVDAVADPAKQVDPAGGINNGDEPKGGWCYPVLTPTKLRGVTIKEGHIQLTAEEAAPYLAAGVISDDVCFPPEREAAE